MYGIRVRFETGDSFSTGVRELNVDFESEWIGIAQEALKRLAEHYRYIASTEDVYGEDLPIPEWWVANPNDSWGGNSYFNVFDDCGEERWVYSGSYSGYFNNLLTAEIIILDSEKGEHQSKVWF